MHDVHAAIQKTQCFMTFPIGDLSVNIRMISPNEPHAGVSNSVLD